MNEEFNFNEEITMSEEERKRHKGVFSKLCFVLLTNLLLINVLAFVGWWIITEYFPQYSESYNASLLMSSVIQYLIAFPIFIYMMKKIPASAPQENKLSAKRFIKYVLISMFVMYVGNYLSTIVLTYIESLFNIVPENTLNTMMSNTDIVLSVAFVGIIGPIIEELMFRKLLIDRLTPYGDLIAIIVPSLIFGLFHGNLYQFFYAFFLGMAFSYVYLRSGKIIYSISIHMFINIFCGIFPSVIMSMMDIEEFLELSMAGTLTDEYILANATPLVLLVVYEFVMLGMVFAGVFMLTRNLRNLRFNKGEVRFPKGTLLETVFFNVGTVALITVCIILMAINTFSV